jgi:hypothetical protein
MKSGGLLNIIEAPKTCFIICPIDKENSDIRKNSDLELIRKVE